MCVLYYNMSVMKIFCEVFTDQNYLPKNLVKAVSVTIFGLFLGKLSQKNLACTTTMMTVLLCVNFGSKLLMINQVQLSILARVIVQESSQRQENYDQKVSVEKFQYIVEEKLPPHDEKSFFYEKIYVVIQYKYKKFVYSFHSHMIMVLEGFAS